jgi:chromosome segregation ATPase
MAMVTELVDQKEELEERIRILGEERTTLIDSIAALKERLANLELERHANSLTREVEALRTEKTVLEEKVASYEPSITPSEGYQL